MSYSNCHGSFDSKTYFGQQGSGEPTKIINHLSLCDLKICCKWFKLIIAFQCFVTSIPEIGIAYKKGTQL